MSPVLREGEANVHSEELPRGGWTIMQETTTIHSPLTVMQETTTFHSPLTVMQETTTIHSLTSAASGDSFNSERVELSSSIASSAITLMACTTKSVV